MASIVFSRASLEAATSTPLRAWCFYSSFEGFVRGCPFINSTFNPISVRRGPYISALSVNGTFDIPWQFVARLGCRGGPYISGTFNVSFVRRGILPPPPTLPYPTPPYPTQPAPSPTVAASRATSFALSSATTLAAASRTITFVASALLSRQPATLLQHPPLPPAPRRPPSSTSVTVLVGREVLRPPKRNAQFPTSRHHPPHPPAPRRHPSSSSEFGRSAMIPPTKHSILQLYYNIRHIRQRHVTHSDF